MAIGQVTVPYVPGYAFGVGADFATGSPMGKVVIGPESPVERAGGATVKFEVNRIQSTEQLEQALGIDAEASYGTGSFGTNVSARLSYAKKAKIQSSSLFMLVTTHVDLAFLSIDNPILSEDAKRLVSSPGDFKARYGNAFVRGIGRGGLFVGSMRIETESSDQSEEISAELKGSYGLFTADIQANFSNIQEKFRASTFIDMYHEGGPVDLKMTNLTDPLQLLDNANRFLTSFDTDADKAAVPYFVTLAPIAIAKGPVPPDAAKLEHAQDVLVACAKARSRTLDKINLLEYILDNASRFKFDGEKARTAVEKALEDFQADLDRVADSASKAIKSPAEASFPKTRAKLPENLPKPKAAKMVQVPDFAAECKSWTDCTEAAKRVHLVPEQSLANMEPGEQFSVLNVAPDPGTTVPEGTVVRIVTRPTIVPPPPPFDKFHFAANIGAIFADTH